ncbi:IS1595 family transposase [bacterium]|nr:IS1595 family transposase [bacterium]
MSTQKTPQTLLEMIALYSDPKVCHDAMVRFRWPDGVECPHCGSTTVWFTEKRLRWQCKDCGKQFTVKVGTIFEDSALPLGKWLPAVWLIANCKNGISSCELARSIGVTQKTAWFMLHRIRTAMAEGTFEKMDGTVEADETFIGGLEKNKHNDKKLRQGRGSVGKTIVMGVLQRSDTESEVSRVLANIIPNVSGNTLRAEITKAVEKFTRVYTDAWKGYNGLSTEYLHQFIDHTIAYAIGQVHTNGLENFWSLLKRALKGTYVSVEPFHLKRYIDEQVFRFNNRGETDAERFVEVLESVDGKRLTYDELTESYKEYYDAIFP